MTVILGLTGSIGMGKSTTAGFFREAGIPVWDADAEVHRLYAPGGAAVAPLAELCPHALKSGAIDRAALKDWIAREPEALRRIEGVVHPLAATSRRKFIEDHKSRNTALIVLDIPLLFETGADRLCDATLTVTAPPEVQRARVLDRGTMTEAQLDAILSKQMPDAEKRQRATYVIETRTPAQTRDEVRKLIVKLTET
ncbi:MAG: dephospho-CoA kinase CoaE [Rhodobacteraceae bacterium HLUCCA12]|nr:MAG: dephospho-CoA kinase CoaE [Rhodobacteraceae bacterium HLUCCA12]